MRQNNELIRRYGLDPEPDMRPLGRVRKIAYARPDRVWRITGATVYAANFTLDEMRQMEAFFRQPGWTKADRKMASDYAQTAQIGQDVGGKAAEGLRLRLTDAPERPQVELAFRGHIRCFLRRDLTRSGLNDPTCVRF
jgi:hypothetical protein